MVKSKFIKVLKVVPPDMTTQNGFVWPKKGPVECPDWDLAPECGNGLHGWRWTPSCDINSSNGYHNNPKAKWLVVRVPVAEIVNLPGKVKFRSGTVIHCGTFESAIKKIQANPSLAGFCGTATAGDCGTATAGYKGTATAGDYGTATAGNGGTATAGHWGTATAGNWGTATAGNKGTATAGDGCTATAGNWGTATAGHWGTATAGDHGTATARYKGTATAGDYGTATAGNWGTATARDKGTATAGDYGTATAGDHGTATAGNGGAISILFFDESLKEYRRLVAEVGITPGIEPGKKYKVVRGRFVEA